MNKSEDKFEISMSLEMTPEQTALFVKEREAEMAAYLKYLEQK